MSSRYFADCIKNIQKVHYFFLFIRKPIFLMEISIPTFRALLLENSSHYIKRKINSSCRSICAKLASKLFLWKEHLLELRRRIDEVSNWNNIFLYFLCRSANHFPTYWSTLGRNRYGTNYYLLDFVPRCYNYIILITLLYELTFRVLWVDNHDNFLSGKSSSSCAKMTVQQEQSLKKWIFVLFY